MKTYLIRLFIFIFLLTSCTPAPLSTPPSVVDNTQTPVVATSAITTLTVIPSPTVAVTPKISTPTFISAPLPDDLVVAYVVEDALWLWTQNGSQILAQQKNIYRPAFSEDGQWILFRQRYTSLDGIAPTFDELWTVRTDGSEIKRLVGSDDLMALTGKNVLIDYFGWLSGHRKILFNTEEIIEGPPGSMPLFDLYSVDLAGQITQLLGQGDAGRFTPSPNGMHIALATGSRIKVFDLESGKQQTLLEFEPVGIPIDGGPPAPKVVWDPDSQYVITSILPQYLYYPEKYAGEPEQVWRLFLNGEVELVAQLQPVSQNHAGISISPNRQYFFYLNGYCPDAMGVLYVRSLTSSKEHPLTCVWNLPRWLPDSEHYIYNLGLWQLGNIHSNAIQPLDILNASSGLDVDASSQGWIDDNYFLLILRSSDTCALYISTLQGIVTEITRTPPDKCPREINFSFLKQ
ncbi:MAG TPA: hypothetical protein PLM89_06060 [Anaerolineales bacterium]|nr:hypothetical protein [Anaerolineales bacterium]